MPKARFYYKDGDKEPILIGYYNSDTNEVVRLISDDELKRIRSKTTERIANAASDIAMQNPTSPLFDAAIKSWKANTVWYLL